MYGKRKQDKEMGLSIPPASRIHKNIIGNDWIKRRRDIASNSGNIPNNVQEKPDNTIDRATALSQLSATINELRIRGYQRIDKYAKEMSIEQLYALLIELAASLERLVFWIIVKKEELIERKM